MCTLETVTAFVLAIGNLWPLAVTITVHRTLFARTDAPTGRAERIACAAERWWRSVK